MTKFNAEQVAEFINSQDYAQFDYQVRGKVATKFGIDPRAAAKWVERCFKAGLITIV